MYIKKLKRKCGVRGCKNIESFALSKSREFGNSIITCKQCALETAEALKDYKEEKKVSKGIPELFFNVEAKEPVKAETSEIEEVLEVEEAEEITFETEKNDFICPDCNKQFNNNRALNTHKRSCKGDVSNEC